MQLSSFKIISLICLLGLGACSTTSSVTPLVNTEIIEHVSETLPELDERKFGDAIAAESMSDVVGLSNEQLEEFSKFYHGEAQKKSPGHLRVANYLENIGLNFEYNSQTGNAEWTLGNKTGNCMSLAVLTTALARAAGIEIKYQLVNRAPIYQEYGGVVFNAQHVRSILYQPEVKSKDSIADNDRTSMISTLSQAVRKKLIIDYYPSRYTYAAEFVNEQQFLSLYYRNLAAEALAKEDYNESFWLAKHSLEIEPDNAHTVNLLAVLHRKVGDLDTAEALYKYGIKHARNKIIPLKNYRILLAMQGRTEEAERIEKELDTLEDDNPFSWLHAANELYNEGDYIAARKLYNKAIELAPYLHQGYFGLARVQFKRGQFSAAKGTLEKAYEEALDFNTKSLYSAKLMALSQEKTH